MQALWHTLLKIWPHILPTLPLGLDAVVESLRMNVRARPATLGISEGVTERQADQRGAISGLGLSEALQRERHLIPDPPEAQLGGSDPLSDSTSDASPISTVASVPASTAPTFSVLDSEPASALGTSAAPTPSSGAVGAVGRARLGETLPWPAVVRLHSPKG
jgi:hypothetical protein